ncbi:MAG: cell wall-binding repeat-containing protein, partial [Candidatus Nanohaloarchaea archaeon]|nr:cell wall-binding repeat-containing protein [Candidatus Nanohaloarchaea archaeon]
MNRIVLVMGVLVALSGFAAAHPAHGNASQHVETVILASTANYPDAMMAAAPANKLGIPVLLTEKNRLSDSTRTSIRKVGADHVVIVGGPAVIAESVQREVGSLVNSTTRLFGTTQIG